MTAQMKWYLVKIVYQVVTGDGAHSPQFDEQLRLIRADELAPFEQEQLEQVEALIPEMVDAVDRWLREGSC